MKQLTEMDTWNSRLHAGAETGPALAGEVRCSRVAVHAVITELIKRLQQHWYPPWRGAAGARAG